MRDEATAEPIDPRAVDVAATAAVYEAATDRFTEKFTELALADRFGDPFVDRLPDAPGRPRILDVGCGPGPDVAAFADRGFDVVGFDLSEGLLRAAADVADAEFVRGDMRDLPFDDGAFDGLWSSASFLHLARRDAPGTLAEFARVLGAEGTLFLSVMAREANDADAVRSPDGRQFTFWRRRALGSALDAAGFEVTWESEESDWHALAAVRE